MKCELCHKEEAQTALTLQKEGKEVELYVCKKCARAEKAKHSEDCAGASDVEITMSGMLADGQGIPRDMAEKVMSAVDDIFSQITRKLKGNAPDEENDKFCEADNPSECNPPSTVYNERSKGRRLHVNKFESPYVLCDCLHLEGLFQTGDIDKVLSDLYNKGVLAVPYDFDDGTEIAHLYEIRYTCHKDEAVQLVERAIESEKEARTQLTREYTRRFGDMICRALAVLKSCRLLDPCELLDLLSPVRIAVLEGVLDGITLEEVDLLMTKIFQNEFTVKDYNARDMNADYERNLKLADVTTAKFATVTLNNKAKRLLK